MERGYRIDIIDESDLVKYYTDVVFTSCVMDGIIVSYDEVKSIIEDDEFLFSEGTLDIAAYKAISNYKCAIKFVRQLADNKLLKLNTNNYLSIVNLILRDECITGKLYNEDNGVTVSSFNSKFKKVFDSLNKDFGKKMDYFGDVDGFSEEQKAGIKFINKLFNIELFVRDNESLKYFLIIIYTLVTTKKVPIFKIEDINAFNQAENIWEVL